MKSELSATTSPHRSPPPQTMATSSSSSPTTTTMNDSKKVRKPYTITKSRESWTEEEHEKFLEALQLFDRDWKKIEDFVGSKSVIQIRSHAQKYFLKVQKNGTIAHVPPPRPKRKAAHPYPQKAAKNSSVLAPGYALWDDTPLFINNASNKIMPLQDDLAANLQGTQDLGSNGISRLGKSGVSEMQKPGQEATILNHGIPDFSEVYSFIGSVFDPCSKGHVQKLKEMDPINFETVLLLMRNLSVNLSSPDFEPELQPKPGRGEYKRNQVEENCLCRLSGLEVLFYLADVSVIFESVSVIIFYDAKSSATEG
ncbi:hypothetical protein ACFE04_003261 [Oxalis oulophora]